MSTPIPSRNPYFGDLHVHTAWSLDAYVMAALNGPDEAFRFAKGEPTHSSLMNTEESKLQRPLDFTAVTDHSEYIGAMDVSGVYQALLKNADTDIDANLTFRDMLAKFRALQAGRI